MQGMLQLHATFPEQRVLVLDNNPFNGVPASDIKAFLSANKWIHVVDHHGAFNDGVMRSTLPRLLEQTEALQREGFLGTGTIAVTNAQNLDPDGLLSFYAASRPTTAKLLGKLLIDTANYTDFAIFGGERFDLSFRPEELPNYKTLGLALLQLITEEKERFVERRLGSPIDRLDTETIRNVFISANRGAKPAFDHSAVHEIYLGILHERLDKLLEGFLTHGAPDAETLGLARRAVVRLCDISRNAKGVTQVYGADEAHPLGRLAVMSPETGFDTRLDKPYRIYDWLQENAAQYCSEAPVHLRVYRGMLVVSVRYPRAGEERNNDYDVSPLIAHLNDELEKRGQARSLYGRKEVVLGMVDISKFPVEEIRNIVMAHWAEIEKKR